MRNDPRVRRPDGPDRPEARRRWDAHLRHAVDAQGQRPTLDAAIDGGRGRCRRRRRPGMWASDEFAGPVDVLFIDEAGQFSLANAVAVSPAAESLVLLGDPQQLDQPTQGHASTGRRAQRAGAILLDGAGRDARGARAVHGATRGGCTRRSATSPPRSSTRASSCPSRATSGRHWPGAGVARRRRASGSSQSTMSTRGNDTESPEEAAGGRRPRRGPAGWRGDMDRLAMATSRRSRPRTSSSSRPTTPSASCSAKALRARGEPSRRVPVGTVDKFQGQQAPISIYSMASSSAEDAPRGMEFLYSLNRLNVATSRARCLTLVVASPALVRVPARPPARCSSRTRCAGSSRWPLRS